MIRAVFNRWPQKLAALVLAVFVWFFVDINDTTISQRALIVPVEVNGLPAEATASGVPDAVNVTLSGPNNLVNNLRADRLSASLNLEDVRGEFQETIEILVPQGVDLLEMSPREVSGVVESVVTKTVPVQIALLETADELFDLGYAPSSVSVRGLNSVLERVERVYGAARAEAGEQEVTLFSVDAAGHPVTDPSLSLEPPVLSVNVAEVPVLHVKNVALSVSEPEVAPLVLEAFDLSQTSLEITGPKERLDALSDVSGTVELTSGLGAGEYTLEVRPELPESVAALERVTARIELSAPPETSDGDPDDSPNSTVRRSDSAQEGEPGNVLR